MGSFRVKQPVDYIGHRQLIELLQDKHIQRFLMITSLGCGDSWQYLSNASKKGFGDVLREKSLAESWLQTSSLDYTILRPGGLRDGAATQLAELSQNVEKHGVIYRADVAQLTETLLKENTSIGEVYACVDASLT